MWETEKIVGSQNNVVCFCTVLESLAGKWGNLTLNSALGDAFVSEYVFSQNRQIRVAIFGIFAFVVAFS